MFVKQLGHAINPQPIRRRSGYDYTHILMLNSFEKIIAFQVVKSNINSQTIAEFFDQCFDRLRNNGKALSSIKVILDNAIMHRTVLITSIAIDSQVCFTFIPPRHSFLNPIEYILM